MSHELILVALTPPLLVVAALNHRGRPWWTVAVALASGAGCALAAGEIERLMTLQQWTVNSLGALMVFTTVVAGMVEELCKYGALRLGAARWIREEYDGVLYGAAVSLGFAALENVGYAREHGMSTAITRAYTAIPLHAACGVIMGSYIGRARVRELQGWSGRGLGRTGVLWAVFLHGLYDAFAFTSTPISSWALYALVVVMMVWSYRLTRAGRARSAAFGGTDVGLPPPVTPTRMAPPAPLPARDERVSAVLGLVPGLGQAYNGEFRKAGLFALVFVVNLALYGALRAFVNGPANVLATLTSWGLGLNTGQKELEALVGQGDSLLAVMLGVVGVWSLYSSLDAWLTARRAARLDGLATSYVLHVALLLALVLAPILGLGAGEGGGNANQGAGDSGGYQITWVDDPKTIEGWNPASEGAGNGKGDEGPEKRQQPVGDGGSDSATEAGAEETSRESQPQTGDVGIATPDGKRARKSAGSRETSNETRRSGARETSAEGAVKSYNDYLSSRFHAGPQQVYFSTVPPDVWTVVRYRISASGTLSEVRVVDTNGTPDQAHLAVSAVRALVPLAPLPTNPEGKAVSGIVVTELFWQTGVSPNPPGSLAEELSHLPDGRRIETEP